MKRAVWVLLEAHLVGHLGVLSRGQAVGLGISADSIDRLVGDGRWKALHRGVYWVGWGVPADEARTYAATLSAGPRSVASHRSAGCLWGLVERPGPVPEVTLPAAVGNRPRGVRVYRKADLDGSRVLQRFGLIAVTDPLRTVVDLAGVLRADALDGAIDRGLATATFTVEGLVAEVARLRRPGRAGPVQVERALARRGMWEPPSPSVLESRVLRLLAGWRIPVAAVEVVVLGGRYRLDVLLVPGLALEVDGYAYHWSPEAMAADNRRRNAIQASGTTIITTTWRTVVARPDLLRREVLAGLSARAGRPVGTLRAG